jgi:hypothetical protein
MPRIHDMSDDEFTDYLAEKRARVDAEAKKIIDALHTPHSFAHRRRGDDIILLLVTVPERETDLAYRASTDGDASKAVSFPKSLVQPGIICTDADGLFIVAKVKAWVAIDRQMKQASVPLLFEGAEWTKDQRAAWKHMQARLKGARSAMAERASKRLPSDSRKPLLNRNEVA